MRVAVLGAAGTIAPAIVRDLAVSEEVESILLLDLRAAQAREVAERQGLGKATARGADARSNLAAELSDVDALVNSASYRINLDAMRACLEADCHYLDLGGLYRVTGEQLLLGHDFERAGLIAVLGIGSSPGKTNLMAARAAREINGGRQFDDHPAAAEAKPSPSPAVDSIDVFAAGRDLEPPPGPSYPYALETLLDEVKLRPVTLRNGDPVRIEPLTSGGEVDFGIPIGRAETIYTLHSELRTFASSFGCKQSSFRLSLSKVLLDQLRKLAKGSEAEVREAIRTAQPSSSRTVSVHMVEASGHGRTVRIRAVTEPHADWGLGGGVVSTAAPIAAAVRLLARGSIEARGALPPEKCILPEEMFAELEQRGTEFELDVTQNAAA
jgi:lysine 6-dehydrogenase